VISLLGDFFTDQRFTFDLWYHYISGIFWFII
jgi:hypothetical protein